MNSKNGCGQETHRDLHHSVLLVVLLKGVSIHCGRSVDSTAVSHSVRWPASHARSDSVSAEEM